MEISQTGGTEDRIAALEKRYQEMDSMVKGLLSELLDLKTISMKMTRQAAEYTPREHAEAPAPAVTVSSDGNTVIRPRSARQPEAPVAPPEPKMVQIMQTDGTMKMEPRYGEANQISSTGGYGRKGKGTTAKAEQAPLIYAADKEKSGSDRK
jgi:hypothetical protein